MMQTVWKFVTFGCTVMAVRRDLKGGSNVVVFLFVIFERWTVEAVELLWFEVVGVVGAEVGVCFVGVVCGVQLLLLGESW